MEEQETSGKAASTAPEHRGQAEEGRSPREAEAFEDAVEESSTASAFPVSCRLGDADVSAGASPSSSPSAWGSQSHEPAAAEEMEAYGSPSTSETGSAAMEGEESPSVSGFRAEPVRVDTGSEMSPSEQRAQGPEEEDEENLMTTPDAGSPSREEPKSRVWSAPPSPMFSGSSESSSPLSQIKQQSRHVRTGSFQRFRQQMQRAWKWGPIGGGGGGERSPREQLLRTTVNIEAMANQKRQWYQIHSKAKDQKHFREPTSLFENFFVVGLHSYANVAVIENAFAKKKAWESDVARSEIVDLRKIQYHGPVPAMDPQILFKCKGSLNREDSIHE
ncbi:hypothetical protein QOZ80_3AG0233550 [Eleusine coracana subsp. coracana]|nr:hypothetical protein QOZ80_3AG0233550 [Eleusine coracana subsp. coracana]